MMSVAKLRIGMRMGLGFGALLLVAMALAAVGMYKLDVMVELSRTSAAAATADGLAKQWSQNIESNAIRTQAILTSPDPKATTAAFKDSMAETVKSTSEVFKKIEESEASPEAKAFIAKIVDIRKRYSKTRDENFAIAGTPEGAKLYEEKTLPLMREYASAVGAFAAFKAKARSDARQKSLETAQQGSTLLAVLAAFAVLSGALIAWLSARSITRPVATAVHLAQSVAEGDLTRRIEVDRHDEIGELQKALARMTDKLRDVIGEVRRSADQIATASTQIASGNMDLSSRTEQQASSLQQTAASVEQLSSTVGASAQSAAQATQLASASSETAARGSELVGQVVTTMDEITQSSRQVSEIVGVIDGIAFQTNILALNAAVEAARAGEQGRGFAVVAAEVRSLAQRSAEAAKQIKSLIDASGARVEAGVGLVGQAGNTMREVVTSAQRVTDLIGEVSAAASEQNGGISQVNTAVSQLDQVTQQNAALVEESAAAAQSLQEQAARLAQAIAVFRVVDQAPAEPTAAAPIVSRGAFGQKAAATIGSAAASKPGVTAKQQAAPKPQAAWKSQAASKPQVASKPQAAADPQGAPRAQASAPTPAVAPMPALGTPPAASTAPQASSKPQAVTKPQAASKPQSSGKTQTAPKPQAPAAAAPRTAPAPAVATASEDDWTEF